MKLDCTTVMSVHLAILASFELTDRNRIITRLTRYTTILASDKFLTTKLFQKSLEKTIASNETTSIFFYCPSQLIDLVDLSTIRSAKTNLSSWQNRRP